jgi:hypothetical protein
MNNQILCEKCHEHPYKYSCSRCKCGYYCSKECQQTDYKTHKHFCKLWNKTGKFNSPFYTKQIITTPKRFPMIIINHMDDDTTNKQYLSYAREIHGETQLHMYVADGNVSKIKQLINDNICINAYDTHHNDALYIACCHTGKNNILDKDIELRNTIVELLLDHGADPYQRGGVSNMTSFEVAEEHGYASTKNLIINHKYFVTFALLREYFNKSTPMEEISNLVKQYHYLKWTLDSIHWLFMPNREDLTNMIIYPKILQQINTFNLNKHGDYVDCNDSKVMIENMFLDYQLKYNNFLSQLDTHCKKYKPEI